MTWLLNEDAAIKLKLQGLVVSDTNGGSVRPVAVRYRLPEDEFATVTFPMIIIDRQHILKDSEREHRGSTRLLYTPESEGGWNPLCEDWNTSPYKVDFPIPYNIYYRITVFSRKEQHNISLVVLLAQQERLPARFGYLEIPEDGTVRSLFLEGGPEFDNAKDADGKRVFRTHYLVRVATEMPPSVAALAAAIPATDINITVLTDNTLEDILV
jgi:hypothetical protein